MSFALIFLFSLCTTLALSAPAEVKQRKTLDDLEQTISNLELRAKANQQTITSLKKENQALHEQLTQSNNKYNAEVESMLPEVRHDTGIAFSATLSSSFTCEDNQVVPFDRAILNVGNYYNTSTGYFQCPVSGVYQFTVTVESPAESIARGRIMVDASQKSVTVARDLTMLSTTGTIFLTCQANQRVWVETNRHDGESCVFTGKSTFSGVLFWTT